MMTREGALGGTVGVLGLIIIRYYPFTRGLGGPLDYTPGIFDVLYKMLKIGKMERLRR
jgi:hypothetical protein